MPPLHTIVLYSICLYIPMQEAVHSVQRIEEKEQIRIFLSYLRIMRFDSVSGSKEKSLLSKLFDLASDAKTSIIESQTYGHGLSSLSPTTHLTTQSHSTAAAGASPPAAISTSLLQTRVIEGLQKALHSTEHPHKFTVYSEQSSFQGVFPVDAAIYYEHELICILEVDGPTHYRYDDIF